MLTRKDYKALADKISHSDKYQEWSDYHLGVIADWLAETNPRFDRERFFRACDPSWDIEKDA